MKDLSIEKDQQGSTLYGFMIRKDDRAIYIPKDQAEDIAFFITSSIMDNEITNGKAN